MSGRVQGGWAITVGDVCGKGQEAAAMTAAARHAIRVIAHWNPDPVDVLAKVNEVILAGDYEDRFVTAKLGRTAAQTTRMVQDLLARFSQDDLRDDMTILVARVTSPAAG